MTQHHQLYEVTGQVDASSLCSRIYGMARVGVAASDSAMNIDLHKDGYLAFFEVIAQLAFDLGGMIEDIERENKLGIYADKPKAGAFGEAA